LAVVEKNCKRNGLDGPLFSRVICSAAIRASTLCVKGHESKELPCGEIHFKPLPEEATVEAKPKRVLVVGDEHVIADTLAIILRNEGYQAAIAYDGLSALSLCESFCPELIITDVNLPGTNGIQMAIFAKRVYPSCKILLFSGQAASANPIEEAQQAGYDFDPSPKPVHPKDLLAKLESQDA
jgi:CheY-like chemotaxis protein